LGRSVEKNITFRPFVKALYFDKGGFIPNLQRYFLGNHSQKQRFHMEAHQEQEVHWGWLLAYFLVIIVLLFVFGDVFVALLGTLIQGIIFAGYHNELHKEI
jgi:hypothetical protein